MFQVDVSKVKCDAADGHAPASGWVGMRTVAQLRREQGIGAPRNTDSLYQQIERAPRKFNPLKIPKALQVTAQICGSGRCGSLLPWSPFRPCFATNIEEHLEEKCHNAILS